MGDGTIEERRHGPYHSAAGSNRTTHVQAFYQHKDLLFSIAYRMLGSVADAYVQWADWVEATGGDDPEKAADLVADLMGNEAAEVNGRFLWIKDALQAPIPSWDECGDLQPWRK